jgi:hypothetical protein
MMMVRRSSSFGGCGAEGRDGGRSCGAFRGERIAGNELFGEAEVVATSGNRDSGEAEERLDIAWGECVWIRRLRVQWRGFGYEVACCVRGIRGLI